MSQHIPRVSLRQFIVEFMIRPALSARADVLVVVSALALLSLTQGMVILLIKGFLTAFFHDTATDFVSLGDIVPAAIVALAGHYGQFQMSRATLAVWLPIGIVLAGSAKAIAGYFYNLNLTKMSLRVAQNYRERIFAGILTLPWISSARRSPGEWMSVIMADAVFIQSRLVDFSTAFVKDAVLIVSCIITLAVIHWPAALILTLIAPLIGWNMGRAGKRIAWFTEAFQRELGVLSGMILGIRERFRFMRAQSGEGFELAQFQKVNTSYLNMMSGSIFLRALIAPGMEFVGFSVFAIFIYGWTHEWRGFQIAPDVVIQFFVALGLVLRPVRELGEQVARWSETVGGLKRSMMVIEELGRSSERGATGTLPAASRATPPDFVLERIEVKYEDRPAFRARNLEIRPGKSIAVVGPSGAGKSTMLKVLAGLLSPAEWRSSLSWENVRVATALVSQTPFLFKDTLRQNLLYGINADQARVTTDEMLWAALRVVNLDTHLKSLPHGLESTFNPLETNLSGGQIQRLVIARALLRHKPVLLLDEATSALDGATERDISTRLVETTRESGTILIMVTHRLRWLSLFDEVWFVENGEIVASGPHEDLLRSTRYQKFVSAGGDD